MGGSKGQKIRLLYLADILRKYTDEEHPLSSAELIERLADMGQAVERKAIYDDISVLTEYGMDIINTRVPKAGYYLAERDFEIPEIYLLSDAVQAAGFISHKKTRELIKKLENMLSRNQAGEISRRVYIDHRNKCENEEIFYNIDAATRAISENKQITLKYVRRTLNDSGKIEENIKPLTVSPYALVWSGDHYYLVCNNEKYDNLMNLRFDRMKKVTVTDRQSRDFSEVSDYKNHFDVADYAQKSFNMYGGESSVIRLRCERELLEQVIDRFSDKISIRNCTDTHFEFTGEAHISEGLVNWIMQFGNGIEVLSPDTLRDDILAKAEKICKTYK